MAHDASLTIAPAAWSEQSDRWLSGAVGLATLADIRRQVDAGASLFHIEAGGQVCGAFVLRVDQSARGPVGVIVAAAMERDGVDATESVLPVIESLFRGVSRIRYHARRPGLVRKMARHGYQLAEFVAYKELQ